MENGNIEAVEKRLWNSADQLRANSNYASNEYFLPVMGLIFLRHAYNRFLRVKSEVEASLPSRGGKTRELRKEDFSGRGAIYLRPEAQFDTLVNLPEGEDLGRAIVHAMETIEEDYENLRGILPKQEYQQINDNGVLRQLLRTFNDPVLKQANGDVFGRIYEYFLTQFADLAAHDNGEFFTPMSLVQMIVNVIEPNHGAVLDPACGSGGMFVQSANFIEGEDERPMERVTFYGMEKNWTTIRLAKMNLAVHGLEGDIRQAITYYEDPHELKGKADFVMANPPFNVDEVDADQVENDPRLPFGLPGVNKKGKISNGNYLWISYFYSYLNEQGRAGFVMSSQASSAGGDEAKVRRSLVETGAVDAMLAIRSNFFYTRSVPCELWFLNRDKPEAHRDKVLMIDARNIYRQVTRRVYDFTPEQLANLTSIVWLYRGETDRFLRLVANYLDRNLEEAQATSEPIEEFQGALADLMEKMAPFLETLPEEGSHAEPLQELRTGQKTFDVDVDAYLVEVERLGGEWAATGDDNAALHQASRAIQPLAEQSRDLVKQADQLYKLAGRVIDICEQEHGAKKDEKWPTRDIGKARKALDKVRQGAVHQLRQARYYYRQAHWLQERFPDAEFADVPGLVKLVSLEEIAENDWSLTPGRYVGVAPEEPDEDFDFEDALRQIHVELKNLDSEAASLAEKISANFQELGG
jgi:type I restriction enzyme M protein